MIPSLSVIDMLIVLASKQCVSAPAFHIVCCDIVITMGIAKCLLTIHLNISTIPILLGNKVDGKFVLGIFSRRRIIILYFFDVTRSEHLDFLDVAFLTVQVQGGMKSHHIHLL